MYDEFGRALERLERAKEISSIGKLSGAVGTNAHLPPRGKLRLSQIGRQARPDGDAGDST